MSKLVILNQGMAGRTFDLNIERTTVGRVEDNTLQIADGSVSSHHAEILLRGTDIVVRDLGSTNGTFINNEKITETVLKPGQTLRFGQVELKIDDGKPAGAPPPAAPAGSAAPASAAVSAPAPTPAAPRKTGDGTMIIPRGVSLEQLEQGASRAPGFDTKGTGFSKKTNKVNTIFIIGGIIVGLIIVALILVAIHQAGSSHQ
ncbi:MAG TPA: FHA domain-containing protein [Verrucomicrobiae bacterium]|nr:FHA domain-containing protein [Verrucomicrobiae bacterium]